MLIFRVNRQIPEEARGIVIVIDVLRAFSVAGYAFAGGASGLWLVRTIEEAEAMRTREPGALLAGEVGGRLIPGFDFNNSPFRMAQADVRGRRIIQRTGAGTQGAVNATHATRTLLCALTNARATALYARQLAQQLNVAITLFPTGWLEDGRCKNEDDVCADYLEALLREKANAEDILKQGLAYLEKIDRFALWRSSPPDFPAEDIPAVLDSNRFDFAMLGTASTWQGISYLDVQQIDV